jgi:fibronectin-binding autotransporter adhesin
MKTKRSIFNSAALSGAAVVFACLTGINPSAQADAYFIGSAGDHNLTTGSNWVGGIAAGDWERMFFGSAVVDGTLNIDNFNGRAGITLTSGLTQDITINGPQPLILAAVGGDGFIDMSSTTKNLTINTAYWMWSPANWNIASGRTLTINGALSENVPLSVTKDGAGTAVLANAVYTGGTIVNGGTLAMPDGDWQFGNPWGVGGADGPITVNAGATLSTSAGVSSIKNGLTLNGGTVSSRGNVSPGRGQWNNIHLLGTGVSTITAGGAAVSTISAAVCGANNNEIAVGTGSTLYMTGGVFDDNGFATNPLNINKTGTGTLVLSAANDYRGNTTINAGTLEIGGAGSLSGGSYTGTVYNSGAFVYSSSANQTLANIEGIGSITQSGAGTLTLSGWGVANSGTITVNSGTLEMPNGAWQQESHHIVVNGGTLSTSDGNSRALSWTLNGGTVSSRGDASPTFWGNLMMWDDQAITAGGAAVSTISSHVMLGAGSGFAVGAGSTLKLTGTVSKSVWASDSAGSLIKTGDGTLVMSGANDYSGSTTINAGTLEIGEAGTLGNGSYAGAIVNNAALVYGSSAAQTLSGEISGTGTLTQNAGTLTLSGANTYTNTTTVNGGTLNINNAASVNNTSGITANYHSYLVFDSGTDGGTISTPISVNNGYPDWHMKVNVPNNLTFTGPITMSGGCLIVATSANSTLNFNNAFHGTDGLGLSFAALSGGKNFFVLSGVSDFTGDISVINWSGSAQVTLSGGADRLPTTAVVRLAGSTGSPAVLDLNGNNQTIAGLGAAGWGGADADARRVVNTSGTSAILTLNTTTDQSSGTIIGGTDINDTPGNNLSLVKTGPAKQELTGASTYSGGTTVSGGTLLVNNTAGSGTGSGIVTVKAGATLSGTGIINGDVTFESDASVLLTTNSTQNLTINGTVTLVGSPVVHLPEAPLPLGPYILATYPGGITGTFASIPIFDSGTMIHGAKIHVIDNQVVLLVTPRGTMIRFY